MCISGRKPDCIMKKILIMLVTAMLTLSCGTAAGAPCGTYQTVTAYHPAPEMYRTNINGTVYIVTIYRYVDPRTGIIRHRTIYRKIYDMYPTQPWNYGRPRHHHEAMPRPRPITPPPAPHNHGATPPAHNQQPPHGPSSHGHNQPRSSHTGPHGHNGRR